LKNIWTKIFKSNVDKTVYNKEELEQFLTYLAKPKYKKNYSESLESRLSSFLKLSLDEQINNLPGLYLLFEKANCDDHIDEQTAKHEMRLEIKQRFPQITAHATFNLLYLTRTEQESLLARMLISQVWSKAEESLGYTRKDIFTNFGYQIDKIFEHQKFNVSSRTEVTKSVKFEITVLSNSLSEIAGNSKTSQWFQWSYDRLTDNYKFLDTFSFVVTILPDFLLTENQLTLLTRTQMELMLAEKAENLEQVNKKLEDEIYERQKAQRGLEQNADRLNKIIENALDAVVLMNDQGLVTFWNSQAEEIFGWTEIEIIGKPMIDNIIAVQNRAVLNKGLARYLNVKDRKFLNIRKEELGLTKDGKNIPLEISLVANNYFDDIIFTCFIRDISERKRYESDLLEAKEKAEKASKSKAEFLSTMSHEIRTPMNGLFGTIELLLSENPREDQLESLNLMKHSSQGLLVILNDILDYSKMEEGRIEFEQRDFELDKLCSRVIDTYSQGAEEKGIELKLSNQLGEKALLIGDPVRLTQVLNNLISNAIKFTAKGSVTFKIEKREESEDMISVHFEVNDTGVGISEANLSRVFERFMQVPNKDNHTLYAGTGLGLAISKKLLNLQGSDLFLTSKEHVGSSFFFDFEFKKSTNQEINPKPKLEESRDLKGLKLLLVEDNKINQIVASKFLNKWNCIITIANNGSEAVDIIQTDAFDLVLMDLQMPIMDGFEAARTIRKLSGSYYQEVPIIALTADVFPEVKQRVISEGMNDFMTKPFDPQKLYFTITSNLLHRH
jgi:PAS domain S-box-containing protein